MLREHDVAGDLLRRIRAATKDFAVPGDACASYKAMLSRLGPVSYTLLDVYKRQVPRRGGLARRAVG